MRVRGALHRSISPAPEGRSVRVIDQTRLPHALEFRELRDLEHALTAIRSMQVRGAPLIGATAAYGLALAALHDPSDTALDRAAAALLATRPTAVNLRWAVERVLAAVRLAPQSERAELAWREAGVICEDDVATCRAIGAAGLELLRARYEQRTHAGPLQVLTHCNAGWLATVDFGTALSPIYQAHDAGLPVHVWVDETRPRNQGASLTAWELREHGVPHTLIADNAGGHLMQRGQVDLCLVGADRVTRSGDVCNKIGTYLKALAARDNQVPFYVAFPHSTVDWSLASGAQIPIEERDAEEVLWVSGRDPRGRVERVNIAPEGTRAKNFGFDVTPARLVTALVTERGVAPASREGLRALYPEAPP